MKTLRIGTRGSRLALTQTNWVAARIREAHPDLPVETIVIHTTGDKILDSALSKIGGKGLFTKEIEQALLEGRIDVAVHSLKDLPTQQPEGLALGAVPERVSPNDLLLAREPLDWKQLGAGDSIGTSSLRRRAQIASRNHVVQVNDLRGNVPTRIRKMLDGGYTAVILAAAGVARLGESAPFMLPLPFEDFLPAPGQGALGLQIRADDEDTRALLAPIHHEESAQACEAERALLHALGGGCQLPLGAFAAITGASMILQGRVASPDGTSVVEGEERGAVSDRTELAQRLAKRLLADGAGAILGALQQESEEGYEHAAGRARSLQELPLGGTSVLVTREEDTDGPLSCALRARGADPLCLPLVQHLPPEDPALLANAVRELADYDWLVFTSARAVEALAGVMEGDAPFAATTARLACVGDGTAEALMTRGGRDVLLPDGSGATGLVLAFSRVDGIRGSRILFPRADRASSTLADGLRALGAEVTDPVAYHTVPSPAARSIVTELREGRVHALLVTSASAVEALAAVLGGDHELLDPLAIGAIGPSTREALVHAGMRCDFVASERSFESLVAALEAWKLAAQ